MDIRKKICVDLRVCQKKSRHTGIGVYAYNFCKHIQSINSGYDIYFLILKGVSLPFSIDDEKLIHVRRFKKPESFQELFDFIDIKYLLKKHDIDVYHSLVPGVITPSRRLKVVYTIHDVIPDIIEKEKIRLLPMRFLYKMKMYSSTRASCLVFDSITTKNDYYLVYNHGPKNHKVIYLGSDFDSYTNLGTISKTGIIDDYIFYVGGFNDRKNVPNLIKAFLRISVKYPRLKLIIAGKPNRLQSSKLISECGLDIFKVKNIEWKGFVPDEEMPELYLNCKFFIYPSLYEGFGLPLLDAMKLGAPIITTEMGSIPEVTGNAALYLNVASVDEIAQRMICLLESESLRFDLIKLGRIRAVNFTWQRTALDTLSVYNQILNDENRN
jgi:glycosyltransferase involved in cell wall biosynthesis